jgi:adenylylsulfate kinase
MERGGQVPVVLITGTVGSGKTALAADVGELLADKEPSTAIIDLDWLGWINATRRGPLSMDHLILSNLAAVWPNFQAAGAGRLVLARTLLNRELVDGLHDAIGPVSLTIVRVTASAGTIAARLSDRDTGAVLTEHLAEATEFARVLDEIRAEDFQVSNDGRPIREVSEEIVARAGWGLSPARESRSPGPS